MPALCVGAAGDKRCINCELMGVMDAVKENTADVSGIRPSSERFER